VYLFDEVDALAGERARANDVGEIRRVLNSFLQFLEQDESDNLLVAASNHPRILDRALFRRFDTVLEYRAPTDEVALQVVSNRLAVLADPGIDWPPVLQAARGLSHAELTAAAETAAKSVILGGGGTVTTSALLEAIGERRTVVGEPG
jgi:SpoVK/Ycf46/Vps4 family AAA+-type ATPase